MCKGGTRFGPFHEDGHDFDHPYDHVPRRRRRDSGHLGQRRLLPNLLLASAFLNFQSIGRRWRLTERSQARTCSRSGAKSTKRNLPMHSREMQLISISAPRSLGVHFGGALYLGQPVLFLVLSLTVKP